MEENKPEVKLEPKAKPETKAKEDLKPKEDGKIKTREGSGYLRQLYSTARSSAGSTHSHFKSLTTFLVNFIPVDKIDASELQVRVHFEDSEVEGLAHSIRLHGVLQPILVVQNGDRYKVIAGERRLRATKLAGLERIPARVITSDDKGVHEIALRENLDRVDLHPIEEGEGYLSLLEAKSYTSYDGIAKAFGKPKSRITECVGFTKLPSSTKEGLMRSNIKQRSVLRELLNAPPEKHSEIIAAHTKEQEAMGEINPAMPLPKSRASAETAVAGTAEKKERKPFAYECSAQAVAVPGFRWKVGEGPERLKEYVEKIASFLAEAQKLL